VTAAELLKHLSGLGFTLFVEADALRYRGPKGQLTAELKAAISVRKAELIELLRSGAHVARLEFPRDPGARFEPFPLTDLQQAYLVGERDFYNQSTIAHLYQRYRAPRLDVDRFGAAVRAVVGTHDALRLVMLPDGRQRVAEHADCGVAFEDLTAQSAAQATASVARMAEQLSSRFPPLEAGPTWQVGLQRLPEGDLIHVAVRLLAFDAITLHTVYRDLMGFYENPDYGPQLPELGYRDYVVGLERFRASTAYQRSLAFWRERVPSLYPAPDLPRARVPASGPAAALSRLSGKLSPTAWRKLREQALSHGRPINTVLCAVYADTLARWARAPEFSLNMLSANRPPVDAATARVVGNCSTTSVVSVTGQGETFAERVHWLQRELYTVLDHNLVSGVEVTRQWARQRSFGEEPPLPIVFSSGIGLVDGTSTFELLVPHPDWHLEESRLATPQVWLDHQVMEERGELIFNWDYAAARYPAGLVEDMFEHYRSHLKDLAERPSAWHEMRSPLPSPQLAARRRANETRLELPGGTLYSLFESAAEAVPERLAICSPSMSLSYAEARHQATLVRRALSESGVRPGDLVGIHLPKSAEQIVATLGVLQAGAAYLPLDWKLPPARVRQILQHAQAHAVLLPDSRPELCDALSPVQVVSMPVERPQAKPHVLEHIPGVEVADSAVAYVIYTSGSTGQPKGVVIDHRGAVNTIRDVNRRFDVTADDRLLALSSLGFDLSVFDMFGAFAAGAAVVVPLEEETPNPELWVDAIERFGVSVWNSVPALMEMTLDFLGQRTAALAKLRLLMLSGDWLPLGLVRRIHRGCPKARLVCLGGATEASIWSNYFDVRSVDPSWTSVPYGFPLANQTFTVLDARGDETPTWVFGDLYIGGTGLAKGYLNDPEKTAASFVQQPVTGERLYRTGDKACYMPDGALEFGGREDAQVKLRGFRVELGEIESVLCEQPGVEAAVAIVHGSGAHEQRLLAFVVTSLSELELAAVRGRLTSRLPSYMVPVALLPIQALPLSSNGKVDRAALQQLGASGPPQAEARIASLPRSATEQKLAELWREVIGVEGLQTEDDFFALGGNSLQAVRLFSAVDRSFGLRLPLSSLFRNRTLAAQAALIDQSAAGEHAQPPSSLVSLRAGGGDQLLALFHPVGGDVLCYEELASRLRADFTVVGLRSGGLDGSASRKALEAMAADYIALLSTAYPGRAIHLAGWSLGGALAYECARQLRATGGPPVQLVLIDSWLGRRDVAPRSEVAMLAGFFNDLLGGEGDVEALVRAASEQAPISAMLSSLTATGRLPRELGVARAEELYAVYSANMRALEQYRPEPYAGDVTLIRAGLHSDDAFFTLEPFWRRAPMLLSGTWRCLELPLNHYQIVRGAGLAMVASAIEDAGVSSSR
jgi:amino acid adenylation domain-containing protein